MPTPLIKAVLMSWKPFNTDKKRPVHAINATVAEVLDLTDYQFLSENYFLPSLDNTIQLVLKDGCMLQVSGARDDGHWTFNPIDKANLAPHDAAAMMEWFATYAGWKPATLFLVEESIGDLSNEDLAGVHPIIASNAELEVVNANSTPCHLLHAGDWDTFTGEDIVLLLTTDYDLWTFQKQEGHKITFTRARLYSPAKAVAAFAKYLP